MKIFAFICVLAGYAIPAAAEVVVATRTLRANSILSVQDVELAALNSAGAVGALDEAIGMEARVTLYAGRPIRRSDLGQPSIIDRNQIVPLVFETGTLRIATEGRALGRGGVGATIRIMNLSSRTTVFGVIRPDGSVVVER